MHSHLVHQIFHLKFVCRIFQKFCLREYTNKLALVKPSKCFGSKWLLCVNGDVLQDLLLYLKESFVQLVWIVHV